MSDNYWKNQLPKNPCPGPVSIEGKAISSKNALKHGCCADTILLKDDNPEDYKKLGEMWQGAYQPKTDAETHMVQELINADWLLQRATRVVTEYESHLFETIGSPAKWTPEQEAKLARYLRYQTTRANNVKRARKEIEDYRKARASEKAAEQKLTIATERHAVQKEKNKPWEWKDELARLKQKSIALGYLNPDGTKKDPR